MIKLGHGDCLEMMKDIADNSIDMVLTDPPYGTTQCKWDTVINFELMWKELKRITKDNGAICLFGSEPFSSYLRLSNLKMFKYDWYWNKDRPSNFLNCKIQPLRDIEVISMFYSKQPTYNRQMGIGMPSHSVGRAKDIEINGNTIGNFKRLEPSKNNVEKNPRTKLFFKVQHPRIHPTQKPVELLEYLIKTYTLENETVLDFTMGSGSTGVAAKNLERKFIGIEMDDYYFSIANARIHGNEEELNRLKEEKKNAK